jgi:hypothetical protein
MRSTCSLSLFKLPPPPETEKLSLRHQFRIVLRHIFPSLRSGDRDAAGMAEGAVAVRAQCGNEPRASSIGGISSAPRLTRFLAMSLSGTKRCRYANSATTSTPATASTAATAAAATSTPTRGGAEGGGLRHGAGERGR